MLNRIISGLLLLWWIMPVYGQDLPRCGERNFLVGQPIADPAVWCIERPLKLDAGEFAATTLAITTDNTLYALRPFSGELYALRDTDGDALPDTPQLVADEMHLPAGMATDGNTLYVLGDGVLYRYADSELVTLLDDLPAGRGFMASGITIHAGAVYIGIPMPCDFCEGDDPLHGTVLRYDLASGERTIVARGLRYPAALAWHEGQIWVSDTARDGLYQAREAGNLDELNAFTPDENAVPHFGFPYCIGADNRPDLIAGFDCTQAVAPQMVATTQSTPLALIPYQGAAFPHLRGTLLVALAESINTSQVRGYQVIALDINREDGRIVTETILPSTPVFSLFHIVRFYDETGSIDNRHAYEINRNGFGVFPHRILGIAVSQEGWLYISVGGGSIYVLRPGDWDVCITRECE